MRSPTTYSSSFGFLKRTRTKKPRPSFEKAKENEYTLEEMLANKTAQVENNNDTQSIISTHVFTDNASFENIAFSLKSCYASYKTNIDQLLNDISPNRLSNYNENGIDDELLDNISFTSESSIIDQAAPPFDSIPSKESANISQNLVELNDIMTDVEDIDMDIDYTEKEAEDVLNNICSTTEEAAGFTPVELTVPLDRHPTNSIPTIVTHLINGTLPSSSQQTQSSLTIDTGSGSGITSGSEDMSKFDKTASLLVYSSGCYHTALQLRSLKQQSSDNSNTETESESETSADMDTIVVNDYSEGNDTGVDESLLYIADLISIGTPPQCQQQDHCDSLYHYPKQTIRPILKKKVNENAALELYRADCCDRIEITEFLGIFEENEKIRDAQVVELQKIRQLQVLEYYRSFRSNINRFFNNVVVGFDENEDAESETGVWYSV